MLHWRMLVAILMIACLLAFPTAVGAVRLSLGDIDLAVHARGAFGGCDLGHFMCRK